MSRFTSLGSAYKQWHTDHIQYMRDSGFFLRNFVKGFRDYIEAPEFYRTFGDGAPVGYVVSMEATRDKNGGLIYNETPRNQAIPDLIRDEDGYWLAGIRVTVEMGPQTEPRKSFMFPLRFVLRDNTKCTMQIGDKPPLTFNSDDPQGAHKSYDVIVTWLDELFAMPPWETAPEPGRIGFVGV